MKSKTALKEYARLYGYLKAVFYGVNFEGFDYRDVEELEHEEESIAVRQIAQTLEIVGAIHLTPPLYKYISPLYSKGIIFRAVPENGGITLWRMKDAK